MIFIQKGLVIQTVDNTVTLLIHILRNGPLEQYVRLWKENVVERTNNSEKDRTED